MEIENYLLEINSQCVWLCEAKVKSLKYHLKHHVAGKTIFSYEKFLVLQIEFFFYSSPLFPLSNNLNDIEALSNAHFKFDFSLIALPELKYTKITMNHLYRRN